MPPQDLNSGDRVVELAGLVSSAAVATGAVASAWIIWLAKKRWVTSACALVGGGIIGLIVGRLIGGMLYKIGENTTVVKVGITSLLPTLRAGLAGGSATAIVIALLLVGITGQSSSTFGIAIGCGIILGALLSCLASLL